MFVRQSQLNGTSLPAIRIFDYAEFWSRLNATAANPSVHKIWVSHRVSQAIINAIPTDKLLQPLQNSPVQRVKARKNEVERKGMRECQIREAVARMKHLGWLEQQLNNDLFVNETQSSEQLISYQQEQERFRFPSFSSISAVGDRAAIVHYSPESATARRITKHQIYLLDVRRIFNKNFRFFCAQYRLVVNISIVPQILHEPIILARQPAWKNVLIHASFKVYSLLPRPTFPLVLMVVRSIISLECPCTEMEWFTAMSQGMYTGFDRLIFCALFRHGIGQYLRVNEGPQVIRFEYDQYEEPLADGMFVSNEPGFYKTDDFGIRIENNVEVIMVNKSTYDNRQFLRFDTITFLPYERSLIDLSLLTRDQVNTIDQYHAKVLNLLQPLLRGDQAALRALESRTAKLNNAVTIGSSLMINLALIFGRFLLNSVIQE